MAQQRAGAVAAAQFAMHVSCILLADWPARAVMNTREKERG